MSWPTTQEIWAINEKRTPRILKANLPKGSVKIDAQQAVHLHIFFEFGSQEFEYLKNVEVFKVGSGYYAWDDTDAYDWDSYIKHLGRDLEDRLIKNLETVDGTVLDTNPYCLS